MHAVLTENDESQWRDDTGVLYHFPKRYLKFLAHGTVVVYYKGKLKFAKYASSRLTEEPHYFGIAKIGAVWPDKQSSKGDLFATVEDFRPFLAPVLARTSANSYLESIPSSRATNYWRDGVRPIDAAAYLRITGPAILAAQGASEPRPPDYSNANSDLESGDEGNSSKRYVTVYERIPMYRKQAIAIHGLTCFGCSDNLEQKYGPYARGLIHVHHTVPVSQFDAPRKIDPAKDLVPVCPNCHAVIHRQRDSTLSICALRQMLDDAKP